MSPTNCHEGTNRSITQWLHNNEVPPDQKLFSMQRTLDSQRRRLAALNTVIRRFPIPALLEEHTQLEESIEAHRVVLHPQRRLPAEILHQIFLECLPTDRSPPVDSMRPPIVLTQVCRRWRTAASRLPELWSSVLIVNQSVGGVSRWEVVSYVDSVKLWFARAGTKPLAVSFYSDPYFTFADGVEYLIPRAILDKSISIRELRLEVSEALLAVLVGGEIRYRRNWPLLEKLAICVTEDVETDTIGQWIATVRNQIWEAPRLRSVVLEGVEADALRLPLRWTQLEELRLSGTPGKKEKRRPCKYGSVNISAMLQVTRNLVSLEISTHAKNEYLPDGWLGINAKGSNRSSELVLRHLATLTLREKPSPPIHSVLDHLQLPALQTLTYDFKTRHASFPPTDQHPLVKFLQRQHDPILIQTLDVTTTSMSPLGIMECLRHTPYLENLCVSKNDGLPSYALEAGARDIPLGDWMLEELYINGQASLCPRLQVLAFEYCKFTSIGFKDFVERRLELAHRFWDPVSGTGFAPLRAVYVQLDRKRPVFVPRAPLPKGEFAECETEEYIRDLGVDARIRFKDSFL